MHEAILWLFALPVKIVLFEHLLQFFESSLGAELLEPFEFVQKFSRTVWILYDDGSSFQHRRRGLQLRNIHSKGAVYISLFILGDLVHGVDMNERRRC